MNFEKGEVKLVEVMWLWDRGQPLDSLPPDELCSRKTVLRGLFGLLNGRDFRQFGEAMLYCSNWKGPDLQPLFQVAHHFGFPPRISSLGEIQSVTVRDQIFHH